MDCNWTMPLFSAILGRDEQGLTTGKGAIITSLPFLIPVFPSCRFLFKFSLTSDYSPSCRFSPGGIFFIQRNSLHFATSIVHRCDRFPPFLIPKGILWIHFALSVDLFLDLFSPLSEKTYRNLYVFQKVQENIHSYSIGVSDPNPV